MLIIPSLTTIAQGIKKIGDLVNTVGVKNALKLALVRYILNIPFGYKVIHKPYFIGFYETKNTNEKFLNLPKLSESRILYLVSDSKKIDIKFFQALKSYCKSIKLKKMSVWLDVPQQFNYDLLFLDGIYLNYQTRNYLLYALNNNLPSFAISHNLKEEQALKMVNLLTDFLVTSLDKNLEIYSIKRANVFYLAQENYHSGLTELLLWAKQADQTRRLPKLTLIAMIPEKLNFGNISINNYLEQDYQGDWEIVFVHNCQENANYLEQYLTGTKSTLKIPKYQIIDFTGFLKIREQITGNLVIFANLHNLVSKSFIKSHVHAHYFQDCDVSVGYYLQQNLEECQSVSSLALLESNPELVLEKCNFQDKINRISFLNINIENLGIKTNIFKDNLNWESFLSNASLAFKNIDIGYQLYQKGININFNTSVCQINFSSASAQDLTLKELRLLLDKYPDLMLVARRWVLMTYEQLKFPEDENTFYLNKLLRQDSSPSLSLLYHSSKRLKILTYPWHIPHQYELYKLPYDFTLITDLGTGTTLGWDLQQRPIPKNVTFNSIRNIDPQDFDMAILHFDENVLSPEKSNGVVSKDWGKAFKYMRENISLPKIAICHGTPQFYGERDLNQNAANLLQVIEDEKRKLVDYVGDILVITNSYQAHQEWKFKNSKVIWHGFDPLEFPASTYARGILAPFGNKPPRRPYYQGYYVYQEVFRDFPQEFAPSTLNVLEPHLLYSGNQYAEARFRNYVNDIRQYSIYFNPTIRSPMPRSRDEAMMCGLTTVSLKNHDVDLFLKNGINGFYSEDLGELKDILLFLSTNPEENRKIGQKGRELAMDIFNHDRYLKAWQETLQQLF